MNATVHQAALRMPRSVRIVFPTAIVFVLAIVAALPQGNNPGAGDFVFNAETGKGEFVHDLSAPEVTAIALGIVSGYLLFLSPLLAFPRVLAWLVPMAWHRQAHRWLGLAILVLALAHGVLLPIVGFRRGWLSGIVALLLLAAHGVSGISKVRMSRRFGSDAWRYVHHATAWSAFAFALFHSFLSGPLGHHD